MMKQVTVSIPATTANLGPGFNCIGLALGLHNKVVFTQLGEPSLSITVQGEDAHTLPTDHTNLVYRAAEVLFEEVGGRMLHLQRPFGLKIEQTNQIPVGSGLGSSATAVLAGLLGANGLVGNPLSKNEILQLATMMEGHADNVAPALFGGLVLTIENGTTPIIEHLCIAEMQVVIVMPAVPLLTSESRAALPTTIPMQDAIFNIGRIALLTKALEKGDYAKLQLSMQDRLHQPYRIPLIPGFQEAMAAARAAGAAAVALSGSGPSLIAFAPKRLEEIRETAVAAFQKHALPCRSWILPIDTRGSFVT